MKKRKFTWEIIVAGIACAFLLMATASCNSETARDVTRQPDPATDTSDFSETVDSTADNGTTAPEISIPLDEEPDESNENIDDIDEGDPELVQSYKQAFEDAIESLRSQIDDVNAELKVSFVEMVKEGNAPQDKIIELMNEIIAAENFATNAINGLEEKYNTAVNAYDNGEMSYKEFYGTILLLADDMSNLFSEGNLTEETPQLTPSVDVETLSQKNAVQKAKDYIEYSAFSYDGLVAQLEYSKFSEEDAIYGADNCGADWFEQAAKKAKSYMEYSSFSREGLIDQLIYSKFTREQAEYGADSVGF
ncbi:MAG: Ltp family lipoprotein [Synergistaceae bacterium]|nr:Ltp family lipoprotein [Synergistaceae bacterium]